jgi:hypothetical protein
MKFKINGKDIRFSLIVSFTVSLLMAAICIFISDACNTNREIIKAYGTALETLSTFSLTFLGFIITAFTVFQIIQSKTWFEKLKTTDAFNELLNAFKLLIIISACGIFIALSLRICVSLLTNKLLLIAGIWLAAFIIAFLCSFSWKTISAIIGLFKI